MESPTASYAPSTRRGPMAPSFLIARAAALACAAAGAAVLAGYAGGAGKLTSLGFNAPPLHPLAALLFVLCGVQLWFAAAAKPPHRVLYGAAVLLKLACITAILGQVFGWTLPFTGTASGTVESGDLASRIPGSVNLLLTIAFGCFAAAAILQNGKHPRSRGWMILPLLPVFWTTYFSIAATFYRVESLNRYFTHTLIPLPTALLFAILLGGMLATQPRHGFMAVVNSRYIGGMLARVAFPVILLLPFTIGLIRIRALQSGEFDVAAAFSQFATTNILVFGAFIWLCAHILNRIDARRQRTLESLQESNRELHRLNHALKTKIEEQVRTEEARKKTELQLFQSQKMEALGTLASGIAHDFNNILTVILLNAESALDTIPDDAPLRGSLQEIKKSGTRAAEVVRQIMTFGRKNPGGEREWVHLQDMVQEAVAMLRHGLPLGVEIRTDIAPGLRSVRADATQIQQVLLNLGTNAAHAMTGEGDLLEFRADAVTVGEAEARLHVDLRARDYVRIIVRDSGHGMDAQTLERIFDPFFTTKPPGKGTGLGLSVVHGIMRLHEGCITARSAPGEGSTFALYFPVDAEVLQKPFPKTVGDPV